jgi:hypothetical protein
MREMKAMYLFSCIMLSIYVIFLFSVGAQAIEYREVKADEIVTHIENGEDVNYTKCRIVGELNISKMKLETAPILHSNDFEIHTYTDFDNGCIKQHFVLSELKRNASVIKSNITITNSIFENDLDFSNALFKNPVFFYEVNFNKSANFSRVNFNYAYFNEVNFNDSADFSRVNFKDAEFYGVNFNKSADFSWSSFEYPVFFSLSNFNDVSYFNGVNFNYFAYFFKANFNKSANFSYANFNKFTDFSWANFNNSVDFSSSSFNDIIYFSDANFNKFADFSGANFNNYTYFYITKFNDATDFSRVNFNKFADFSGANFNNSADFSAPDTSATIITNDVTTCEMFRSYYKSKYRLMDADIVYFNYRNEYRSEKNWYDISKWWDYVYWVTCGYGIKPLYILNCAVFLIIIFAYIYRPHKTVSVVKSKNKAVSVKVYWKESGIYRLSDAAEKKSILSFWDALYFSIHTFTRLGSTDLCERDDFRKWVTLEGLLGWIILALFLSMFTGYIIKL